MKNFSVTLTDDQLQLLMHLVIKESNNTERAKYLRDEANQVASILFKEWFENQ